MDRFAAFLRGINVGGHRLTSEELRAHLAAIGFVDVETFRASGNVVLAAERQPAGEIAARVERGLAAALGYEVPTFVRSASEMLTMAAFQPFEAERVRASAGKLQVMLLSKAPAPGARATVLALADERDGLVFGRRELYWLPNGPMLQSVLDLKAIERLLGVSTLRTKGTIEQIAIRHFDPQPAEGAPAAR